MVRPMVCSAVLSQPANQTSIAGSNAYLLDEAIRFNVRRGESADEPVLVLASRLNLRAWFVGSVALAIDLRMLGS